MSKVKVRILESCTLTEGDPDAPPQLLYQWYMCDDDPPPTLDNYMDGNDIRQPGYSVVLWDPVPNAVCLERPEARAAWDTWLAAHPPQEE